VAWGFDATVRKLIAGGRNQEAAALLRDKTRRDPRPKPHHLNFLGVCEAQLGHPELAKELFRQVLLLAPRDAKALNNLGNLAYIAEDSETARDYYLKSLRESVWATEPRYNLTALYQDIGHSEKALSSYEDYVFVRRAILWARIAAAGIAVLLLGLALSL
jgi:Flp pilus assembly protein TadD